MTVHLCALDPLPHLAEVRMVNSFLWWMQRSVIVSLLFFAFILLHFHCTHTNKQAHNTLTALRLCVQYVFAHMFCFFHVTTVTLRETYSNIISTVAYMGVGVSGCCMHPSSLALIYVRVCAWVRGVFLSCTVSIWDTDSCEVGDCLNYCMGGRPLPKCSPEEMGVFRSNGTLVLLRYGIHSASACAFCGVPDWLKSLVGAVRWRNRDWMRTAGGHSNTLLSCFDVIKKEWFLCCNYALCCCVVDNAICSEEAGPYETHTTII